MAGAGFAVCICGNIVTMPGLQESPQTHKVVPDGQTIGLSRAVSGMHDLVLAPRKARHVPLTKPE